MARPLVPAIAGVYTRASARNSPIETAPVLLEINICKILGVTPVPPVTFKEAKKFARTVSRSIPVDSFNL